ncbi:MAG: hypothetical protein EBU46_06220, partial [Nitrosomonadaceae bacterium]|nr:hypothetical protein [Nitrosomonadaceae bacterium]
MTVSGLTNGYATIRAVFGSNVIASTSLAVVGIRYPWRTIFLKNSAPVTITPEILPWGVGATFMMTNAQTWPWHDPAPLGDQTFSLQFDGYNLTVRGAIEFTTAGIAAAAGDLPYRVGATVANAGDVRSDLSARYEDGVVRISRFGNERFSYGINIYRDNVTRLADPSMLVTFPGGWFDDYSVLPGNTYVYRANRAIPYYTNITALLSGTVVSGLEFERSGYGLDKTIPSTSLMFIGGGGHDAAGYAEGNHFMMSSPVFYHLWSGGIGYTSPPAVYANNGIDMRGFLNDEYYLQHPEDRLFPDSLLSTITIPPASPVLFGVSRGNTNLLSWSVPYGATGFYVKRAQNSNGPYATLSQVPQTDWQFADPVTSGGGTYYYVVSAVNAGGEGPDSDPINPGSNPLPEAPAELTVYTTNGQVVLNWSAVSNAGSYRIRRSTLSGSSYQLIEATTNVTYTDGTVVAGNTYYYVVAGQNQYGYGQESTEIALTLKPATPEGLTAAAGTNQVSLIWTPSMGTVSYSILRATNASGPYVQVNTNAQPSYVDESVVGGLTYYYAISASNAGGQSVESQAVSVRPYRPAVLPTPQMLFALSGNQQVSLQWLPATGVTNYLVKRSLITGGPYRFVAAISGTNYVDANLINGLTYFYVVEAAEGIPATAQAQIDTNSQVVTNVALLSPGVGYLEPPMVMLVDGTGSGAAATVQLTNDMVSGFTITNGGSSYLTAPEVVLSGGFAESLDSNEAMGKPMPPLPGPPTLPSVIAGDGQAILTWSASTWADGYVVSRSQFSGGPYDYLGSVTGTNFTNSGLINGLVYYYTLVATNLSGSSATSPEAMITLPPNSPTGLTATATGRRVNLIWNPVTYASGYRILRSTNDGGPYAPVQVVNDTNWEDSRLGFGTTYYYEVSAVNSGGDGLPSVQASATTDPLIIDNAPTLTKVRTFRMAFENTAFPITYERLLAMSDAADADGDLILFSIESVDSGILQMNGTNISAGQALLGPGQSLMWTPFTNSYGAGVAAFSVKVNDGAMSSEVAVTVNVDVAATAKVATWGKQVYADLSFGGGQCNVIPAIVTMLTNTVEVAAGYYHSLARCADGSVWVWGEGQSGQNPPVGSSSPMLVIGISNAVSIASGYDTCYVLQPNGDIYAWGFGSIAMPITRIATVTNAIALAGDLAVLTANGTVLKWNASLYEMQPAGGVNDAREISTSAFGQSLILRTNGTVWSFPGVGGDTSVASAVAGLENVVGIATGDSHYLALKADGTVWAWGFNTYGQIGQGEHTNDNYSTPLQVPGLSNIVTVAAGWDHSFAQNASGMIWAWGLNSDGQLGTGWDINSLGFRFFEDYPDSDGILDSPTRLVGITNLVGLSGGRYHSLGVGTDGTAWAWGSDFTGALGVGYVAPLVPAANSSLNDIAEVAEGFGFHLALRTNGTVLAWGNNYYYSLGTGSIEPTNRFTPGLVVGLTNVIRIAAGGMHGVALKNDSTVWAWGWGYYNQLGNKGKKSSPNPVQLSTLNDVIDIACGFSHSIALKSDGSVWEWGGNPLMEDGMSSATPISVFGLSNITSIAAAQFHNLAVSVDGRVLAWGKNYYGILGNGTTNDSVLPVPVLDLSNIVAVAAGDYHSMALDSEGKVYVWGGIPGYSTLGLGTAVTTTLNPICLNTLTNVTAISAGGWHSCAVTDDGTVWSWGAGTSGQIGDGYAESRFVPTVVVGLTNATGVSAGYDSGIALAVLLPPGITGVAAQPADGRVALTWNPYSLASEFYVKRSTNQGASYSVIATVTTNGYVDTSVNDGTTYSYVISAAGTTGESPNSRGVTVTPLAPPPAPTNFVATPLGRQVALNWTATPTAASYKVRRAQVSGGPYTQIATVTNTSYVDTRLFNGTAYYYIVSGINCG